MGTTGEGPRTVSIDPARVGEVAGDVRRLGDLMGSLAEPTPVDVVEIGDIEARMARRHPLGPQGLQACLASFEEERAGFDRQVSETFRAVSDHLAVIAVDATTADTVEYLPLPRAGS